MLISNQRRFIYVHIFKTGGTSVKRALRRYAMPAWQESANFFLKRMGIPQFGPPSYGDHCPVSRCVDSMGVGRFAEYFSFAFVRNPWDWEVSHYEFIRKLTSHASHEEVRRLGSFGEYIRWRCDGRFHLQSSFLEWQGESIVQFVGRFERLAEDYAEVCRRIQIPARLPRLNRTRRRDYRTYYDPGTADLVDATYAEDIRRFNYRFEPLQCAG